MLREQGFAGICLSVFLEDTDSWETLEEGKEGVRGLARRVDHSQVRSGGQWEGLGVYFPGPRPEAKCLGFHFLVNGGCGSWVDFWISTVNPRNRPLVPAPALLHTPRTSAMGPAPLSTGDRKSQTHTHLPRALGGPEVTGARNKWS